MSKQRSTLDPPNQQMSEPPPATVNGGSAYSIAENPLSEREMDVARLLATGASNGEIASELIISPHTVKVHLRNIYEKLGVSSRTEASMLLVTQGWIAVPGMEPATDPEDEETLEAAPLASSSGAPFGWQPLYLLLILLLTLGVLFAPFLTRPVESVPNLLSDSDAMAVGRPAIAEMARWESRTPLSAGRSRLALVVLNDRELYAIGGESADGQPLAALDIYDLQFNIWRQGREMPAALANSAAAADNRRIVVAGGSGAADGNSPLVSDLLLAYTPGIDAWEEWGRLPRPLAGAALVLVEDGFYLLGGWDGETMRDEVWRLPADSGPGVTADAWTLVSRLESGRAFLGAAVVDDIIYVVGGYDGRHELRSAHAYNVLTGRWSDLPDLAAPRGGLTLLYDGLALFAVGGGWSQSVDTIERYDPATGLWSNFPAPIASGWRHLGGAASSQGHLYLVGGWSGSYLDVHLRYQSSFRTFFPSTKKENPAP